MYSTIAACGMQARLFAGWRFFGCVSAFSVCGARRAGRLRAGRARHAQNNGPCRTMQAAPHIDSDPGRHNMLCAERHSTLYVVQASGAGRTQAPKAKNMKKIKVFSAGAAPFVLTHSAPCDARHVRAPLGRRRRRRRRRPSRHVQTSPAGARRSALGVWTSAPGHAERRPTPTSRRRADTAPGARRDGRPRERYVKCHTLCQAGRRFSPDACSPACK